MILEGTDGSGKSALISEAILQLGARGQRASRTSRLEPSGDESYARIVNEVRHLFRIAEPSRVPFYVLGLGAALQYAAIYEGQVIPALNRGEVVFAESWWAKTWARLFVEALRVVPGLAADPLDFREWLRGLGRVRTAESAIDPLTVLVDSSAADRRAWYQAAAAHPPVYDSQGQLSVDPGDFAGFTQEVQGILIELAGPSGWHILQNAASKPLRLSVSELIALIDARRKQSVMDASM